MVRFRLSACLALLSCSGAEPGIGSDLNLRVGGAQLERGRLPAATGSAEVTFVDWRRSRVQPGEAGVPIAGRVNGQTFALNIALEGDRGYWVRPVGVEDPAVAGELSWSAGLDFSHHIRADAVTLLLQGVDGHGNAGGVRRVETAVSSGEPSAELAVRLEWDTQSDLDLYVTEPSGITAGPKNINTYEPPEPGERPDEPDAYEQGGMLDVDSNANCVIDGRRRETYRRVSSPPDGNYQVHVDLAALCGMTTPSSYRVTVELNGEEVKRAEGVLYEVDALNTTGGGAVALLVLEFALLAGALE